ncbi:hypothetical protein LSM04_006061 [Trypanosoma melophagium]|uniref:uncharacterized protein n=1 Tax=Trypanosoma melophagium TaxID=715481 RepID=UPI00351A6CA2|nr:hypothetical protein LSM04_006061 [Trypanosoma melophagium]
MTTDLRSELHELERCEPLSKCSESQTDWLLSGSHPYGGGAANTPTATATTAAPPPPIISIGGLKLPEEEAASEGLSRIDSAATPPAVQLHISTHTPTCSERSGVPLESTVVTLEVSSSSIDTDVVMASRLGPRPASRTSGGAGANGNNKKKSNSLGSSGSSRKGTRLPTAKRERGTLLKRRPQSMATPHGESVESLCCTPRVVPASAGKRTAMMQKNTEKQPEKTTGGPVVSPRPALRRQSFGAPTTAASSPAILSRENSVATIPANQKGLQNGGTAGAAGGAASPRFYGRSYQGSPDVVVSSDSENEAGLRESFTPYRTGQGRNPRSRRRSKSRNEPVAASPELKALPNEETTMGHASLSDVAVVDVVEITMENNEETRRKATDWTANAGQVTFTHRCDYNMMGFAEDGELELKPKGSRSLTREDDGEEEVSFSEMKRVAAEEEKKQEERRIEERERPVASPQAVPQSTVVVSTKTVEKNMPSSLVTPEKRGSETEKEPMFEEDDCCKKTLRNTHARDSPTKLSQIRGGVATPISSPVKATPIAEKPPTPKVTPLQLTQNAEGTSPPPATKVSSGRKSLETTTTTSPPPQLPPSAAVERLSASPAPAVGGVPNNTVGSEAIADRPYPLTQPAYMNPHMKHKANAKCCSVM